MIEILDNKKYKSWKPSSNIDQVVFKRKNLIFGLNGSGKSSFAYLLQATFSEENDQEHIRVFNENFINETLSLKDDSIQGVISNFGKKDVDIEQQVERNILRIKELEIEADQKKTRSLEIKKKLENYIEEIVSRRKGMNTKIHNKPKDRSTEEKFRLWIKDYEDCIKSFPNENYNEITGNVNFSIENENINQIVVPNIPEFEYSLIENLPKLLEMNFQDVGIPSQTIIDWLEEGLRIHKEKGKCAFCGSQINYESIEMRVSSYLKDETQKASKQLTNTQKAFINIQQVAEEIKSQYQTYKELFLPSIDDKVFDGVIESEKIVQTAISVVDQKLNKMEASLSSDMDSLKKAIANLNHNIGFIKDSKSDYSQRLLDKINRLELLVKGAIGYEIKNSKALNDDLIKASELEIEASRLNEERKKLDDDNNSLLVKKSDLSDFAEFLNITLGDINLDFILKPQGVVYILQHKDGTKLRLKDISEGERNLLSLIYFYYEMLNGVEGMLKESIELILLDDPISSLDDNNRFYILEIIKTILDQKSVQLFILTHSWADFCTLSYGRNDREAYAFFEIKKESAISNIYDIDGNKLLSPYVQMYCEIEDFCNRKVDDISTEESLHIPNTMRRVLEEYTKFNVNLDLATAANTGDICKALFKKELSKLSMGEKQKLNQLLSVCNILSHKATHPHNPTEIYNSAKFLRNTIKECDKYHHLKMTCYRPT